jgi:hypothetical protein
MALLVHLRVLCVRGLGVTAAVSARADIHIVIGGRILSHAFGQTWTLRSVLRRRVVARGCGLVSDRGQLRVGRALSWYTDSLPHLTVDRGFTRRTTLMGALLCICPVALVVSLALGLLLLLLCLPLLANFLEL